MRRFLAPLSALLLLVSQQAAASDFLINPYVFAGGAPPPAATIEFCGSASDATNADSHSHAGLSICSASADRVLIIVCSQRGSANQLIDTITVAGNAATLDVQTANSNGPQTIAHREEPTGTTATIVCGASNTSGNPGGGGVAVYAMRSALSATPVDNTGSVAVSGTTDCGFTLSTAVADGVAVASVVSALTTVTETLTGVTEQHDGQIGAEASGFASGMATTTGALVFNAAESGSSARTCIGAAYR